MAFDSDDNFDDEIIEIFVEEVGDVLEQIDDKFPLWENNNANDGALKEVRRAFHTLKGSGRMVGAEEIGELAWAIESMLNRVIDGSLKVVPPMFELVSEVRKIIPLMVKAFKNKQAAALAGVNFSQLIEQANDITEGKPVSPLTTSMPAEDKKGAEAFELSKEFENLASENLANLDSAIDMVEIEALRERITELARAIDEIKRAMVPMSSRIDQMAAQIKLLPKGIDPVAINKQLKTADQEIQELKYFMKVSSEQMMSEVAQAQKRLSHKVDKELKIISNLGTELHADMETAMHDVQYEMSKTIKAWSIGSAVVCSLLVFTYVLVTSLL